MGLSHSFFKETSQQDTPNGMEDEGHVYKVLSMSDNNVQDRPSMEEYFEPSGSAMDQSNSEKVGPTDEHFVLKVLSMPSHSALMSDSVQGPSGLQNSRSHRFEEKNPTSNLRRFLYTMAIIALLVLVSMIFMLRREGPTLATPTNTTTTGIPSITTAPSSNNTTPSSNNTTLSSNNTTLSSNNTTLSSNNTTLSSNNTTLSSNNTTLSSNNTTLSSNNTTLSSNNTNPPTTTKPKKQPHACIQNVPYIRRPILINCISNCLTIGHELNLLYVIESDKIGKTNSTIAISLENLGHTLINKKNNVNMVAVRDSTNTYIIEDSDIYRHEFTSNISKMLDVSVDNIQGVGKMYYFKNFVYFLSLYDHGKPLGKICYIHVPTHKFQNFASVLDLINVECLDLVKTSITAYAVIDHKYEYLYVTAGKLYQYKKGKQTTVIAERSFTMAVDKYNTPILSDDVENAMYKFDFRTEGLVPYANYTAPPSQIKVFDFDRKNRIVYLDGNGSVVQWVPTKEYGKKCEMIVNVP